MSGYPDGEAQKRVYEQLAAVHLDLATLGVAEDRGEFLVELARTLAKGGPHASTVERWARDHGYGQAQTDPQKTWARRLEAVQDPDPEPEPRMEWPSN